MRDSGAVSHSAILFRTNLLKGTV